MGSLKAPPVTTKSLFIENVDNLVRTQAASNLCFMIKLTDSIQVSWETVLRDGILYVEVPDGILPDGSKESFVTLLEYAEDILKCKEVIVCFRKNRADRAVLIRTFMFLGFSMIPPGSPVVPNNGDLMFMGYEMDFEED